MYCCNCGKQVSSSSRFCPSCGKNQPRASISQFRNNRNLLALIKDTVGPLFTPLFASLYLLWIFVHLFFLFRYWEFGSNNKDIWPFHEFSSLEDYDISEFFLYSVGPLVFYISCRLAFQSKGKSFNFNDSLDKFDHDYKISTIPTTVGVLLATILLIYYISFNTIEWTKYPEWVIKQLLVVTYSSLFILRLIVVIWTIKIASRLKRDKLRWGIFALFVPLLALCILGSRLKLK